MTASINIRPLNADDWTQWQRLWTAYLAFYKTELPEVIFRSTFDRLLKEDAHEFHGLIAEVDGTPRGLTHFLHHRHCWRIDNTTYLQDLYVDPEVRGTGLGRALIEAVYARADAAGAPVVYWITQEDNTTARQLYDRIAELQDFVRYDRSL